MTLREMRLRMDAEEYWEWVEYYNIEPFGPPREEAKHADLMSSLWTFNSSKNTPAKLRDAEYWKYHRQTEDIPEDPELEAEIMLKKTRG